MKGDTICRSPLTTYDGQPTWHECSYCREEQCPIYNIIQILLGKKDVYKDDRV